jgi:hypothetical protein
MSRITLRSAPMENIDRSQLSAPYPTAQRPKTFATQFVDALIDGAAAIAKGMILGPFARIDKSDQTGLAAMAVVSSAEETGQERPRKADDEKSVGAKKSAFATKAAKEKGNARSAKKTAINAEEGAAKVYSKEAAMRQLIASTRGAPKRGADNVN